MTIMTACLSANWTEIVFGSQAMRQIVHAVSTGHVTKSVQITARTALLVSFSFCLQVMEPWEHKNIIFQENILALFLSVQLKGNVKERI